MNVLQFLSLFDGLIQIWIVSCSFFVGYEEKVCQCASNSVRYMHMCIKYSHPCIRMLYSNSMLSMFPHATTLACNEHLGLTDHSMIPMQLHILLAILCAQRAHRFMLRCYKNDCSHNRFKHPNSRRGVHAHPSQPWQRQLGINVQSRHPCNSSNR
jgi:hypothetical protein